YLSCSLYGVSINQSNVSLNSLFHLAQPDKLIGGMGAGRVPRAGLYGGEGAESLVRQGGGAVDFHAQSHPRLHQRMIRRDAAGVQPERTGAQLGGSVLLQDIEHFPVGV